jgi:hypothetical protein
MSRRTKTKTITRPNAFAGLMVEDSDDETESPITVIAATVVPVSKRVPTQATSAPPVRRIRAYGTGEFQEVRYKHKLAPEAPVEVVKVVMPPAPVAQMPTPAEASGVETKRVCIRGRGAQIDIKALMSTAVKRGVPSRRIANRLQAEGKAQKVPTAAEFEVDKDGNICPTFGLGIQRKVGIWDNVTAIHDAVNLVDPAIEMRHERERKAIAREVWLQRQSKSQENDLDFILSASDSYSGAVAPVGPLGESLAEPETISVARGKEIAQEQAVDAAAAKAEEKAEKELTVSDLFARKDANKAEKEITGSWGASASWSDDDDW